MAVSVTHAFVSAVPDGDDTSLVRPSNWNADHTVVGLGTAAEADTGDFATAVQGALADSALQPADIGVTVQGYDADLAAWAGVNPSSYSTTAQIAAAYQPLDSDLTAIAALTTTAYGRSLLTMTAAEDVRNSLDAAPYVATRTALKALDTTKDTTAIFDGSVWLFTAFDFTTLHALDTGEGVYIKADAVASATGGWTRKHDGVLSAKWFTGVTGDGVSDDAAGLTAALRLNSLFKIYLPAGTYLCNSAVTRDGGYVNIEGEGQYVSVLKFGDTDGLSLGQTTPILHTHIRDIAILTTAATTTRRAVVLTCDRTAAQKNPSCIFERMEFRGDVTTADWWQKGIHVTDPALPIFRDLQFFGRSGGTSAQLTTLGSVGIEMHSTLLDVVPVFDNVFGLDLDKGLYIHTTGNPGAEGVYISHTNFTQCNYGAHITSDASGGYKSTQIHVVNNQFQCYIRSVWLNECKHFNISDNLFYGYVTTSTEAVYVEDSQYGNIGRNQIEQLGGVTMKGIVVHDSANVIVSDNVLETTVAGVEFTGFTFECTEKGTQQNGSGAAYTNTSGAATNLSIIGAIERANRIRQQITAVNPNNVLNGGNTAYFGPSYGGGTENVVSGVMSTPGLMRDLRVVNTVAPGGAQTTTYTLMKNGSATALTCQVSASGTTASDTTNEVTFAAGDTWSIRIVASATAAATLNKAGMTFVPTIG